MRRIGSSRPGPHLAAALAVVTLLAACTPAPTPRPATPPPVVFAPIEVIGIGDLAQGETSEESLVIRITEIEADSIPRGPGSFDLVLADSAGGTDEVVFTRAPELTAPGSLGVTARLSRSNVLTVEIVDSDTFNVEQVTIAGLAISAAASAPTGPLSLEIAACSGSLAGCAASDLLGSPATVVVRP
jgi:hypothetical protein